MGSKVDVSKIIEEMNALAKTKKSRNAFSTGANIVASEPSSTPLLLSAEHPLARLLGTTVIPYDRIIQVAGEEDCGKSTWAGELAASAQRSGVHCILWDAEKKFNPSRFASMGGDNEKLFYYADNSILQGGESARRIIHRIKKDDPEAKILLIWDSVGSSQSRSHAERDLDDEKHAQPGQDAKENSSFMKVVVALMNKYPDSIAVYLVNQAYAKIGFMQHGNALPGGRKIAFHSSLIVTLKRIKFLTKVQNRVKIKYGIISRATVTKNHLSSGPTSIHQLDFKVTAEGSSLVDSDVSEEEDDE